MSFLYPYAFLILLAIPVLIIIYLLKNKYKESTTPSTYLWELSKKFLKKCLKTRFNFNFLKQKEV